MERDEKIEQLQALLAADPADALGWFLLGSELLRVGRSAEAAVALTRCLALTPRHTAACKLLGDAHRKAGDAAAARSAYQQAIALAETTGDLQAGREAQALLSRLPPGAEARAPETAG